MIDDFGVEPIALIEIESSNTIRLPNPSTGEKRATQLEPINLDYKAVLEMELADTTVIEQGELPKRYLKDVRPRLFEIFSWRQQGMNYGYIARRLGLNPTTLAKYRATIPELMAFDDRANEMMADKLASNLLRNAAGFYYEEEVLDSFGDKKVIKKFNKPDTRSALKLMSYWDKPRYRETKEIIETKKISTDIAALKNMTTEELLAIANYKGGKDE